MFKRVFVMSVVLMMLVCALPWAGISRAQASATGTWTKYTEDDVEYHVKISGPDEPIKDTKHKAGEGAKLGCTLCADAAVTIVESYVAREASCGDPGDFVMELSDGSVIHQQVNSLVPKQHDYYPLDVTSEGEYYHGCKNEYIKTPGGQAKQCSLREECAFSAWQVSADGSAETCTCSKCGRVLTRAHTYVSAGVAQSGDNAGKYVHKCSTCGREEPCVFDLWAVTKQPTCGEAGECAATCKICGQTATQAIPATGRHTKIAYKGYKDGEHYHGCENCTALDALCSFDMKKQAATCTKNGYEKLVCSKCGFVQTNAIISPLGHDYAIVNGSAASDDKGVYCNGKCIRCDVTKKLGANKMEIKCDESKGSDRSMPMSAFYVKLYRDTYLLSTTDLNNQYISIENIEGGFSKITVDAAMKTITFQYVDGVAINSWTSGVTFLVKYKDTYTNGYISQKVSYGMYAIGGSDIPNGPGNQPGPLGDLTLGLLAGRRPGWNSVMPPIGNVLLNNGHLTFGNGISHSEPKHIGILSRHVNIGQYSIMQHSQVDANNVIVDIAMRFDSYWKNGDARNNNVTLGAGKNNASPNVKDSNSAGDLLKFDLRVELNGVNASKLAGYGGIDLPKDILLGNTADKRVVIFKP